MRELGNAHGGKEGPCKVVSEIVTPLEEEGNREPRANGDHNETDDFPRQDLGCWDVRDFGEEREKSQVLFL